MTTSQPRSAAAPAVSKLLSGIRALVFEGDDEIGSAISRTLRNEGAWVVQSVEDGIAGHHADPSVVAAVVDTASSARGGLDLVVNAVTDWWVGDIRDVSREVWVDQSRHNSEFAFAVLQESMRVLDEYGSIVTISTVWATATTPEVAMTGATKSVLGPLTKAFAQVGVKRSVRVNLVLLGLMDTPSALDRVRDRAAVAGRTTEDSVERLIARIPLRRPGQVDELARSISFLASPYARWINGCTIPIDGGLLNA